MTTLSYKDLLNDLPSIKESLQPDGKGYTLTDLAAATDPLKSKREDLLGKSGSDQCPTCAILMEKFLNEYYLVCSKCGYEILIGNSGEYTLGASDNHNTSDNAYMYFKPVGAKHRLYQNTMIKCTSEYEPYRDNKIKTKFIQKNFVNEDFQLPLDVIRESAELFIVLKNNDYVRRGKNLRGVEAACVYEKCQEFNITKTKAQVAKMYNIDESKVSFGLDELYKYKSKGIITMQHNKDPTSDYVDALFEIFNIEYRYKKFIVDLSTRIDEKKVLIMENCFNKTKVVALIYLLGKCLKLDLEHAKIAPKCDNISRGTYVNIYKSILKYPAELLKVFIKHQVPVPEEWSHIQINTAVKKKL